MTPNIIDKVVGEPRRTLSDTLESCSSYLVWNQIAQEVTLQANAIGVLTGHINNQLLARYGMVLTDITSRGNL